MRITYDVSADNAYIDLRDIEEGGVAKTHLRRRDREQLVGDINRNCDADRRLIGIESIGARRGLRLERLKGARKP